MSLNEYILPSSVVFLILLMSALLIFTTSKKYFDVVDLKFLFLFLGVSFIGFLFPFEIIGINPVINSFVHYPRIIHILGFSVKIFGVEISVLNVFLFVWIAVSIMLMFLYFKEYSKSSRNLSIYYKHNKNSEVLNKIISELKEEFSYDKDIIVTNHILIKIPCVFGLFNPVILLPNQEFSERDLYWIIRHEFCHIYNKDRFIKLIVSMIKSVFWILFGLKNLFEKSINELLEVNCDKCATENMTTKERREYVDCITRMVDIARTLEDDPYNNTKFFINMADVDESFVMRRFEMIFMKPHKNIKLRKVIYSIVILVSIFTSMIIFQPAYNLPTGSFFEDVPESFSDEYSYVKYDGEFYYVYDRNDEVVLRTGTVDEIKHLPIID